jgi:hypothetical protein
MPVLRPRGHHPRMAGALYSSRPGLRRCGCKQVSIETAQSKLARLVLAQLDDNQTTVGRMGPSFQPVAVSRLPRATRHILA